MKTLSNVRSFQSIHKIRPILYAQSIRRFAEGEQIVRPRDGKYKNVFNKRISRCGRFTYYSTFPHDYNEPWPFMPVYDQNGEDLNQDPVWGEYGKAIPCSITGKPKRALGHYPWLGRPVVPLDDSHRYIYDDQVAPFPFFRIGDYDHNRKFWWQNGLMFFFIGLGFWFTDHYWAKNVSYSWYRNKLFFKEELCNDRFAYAPMGVTMYSNPAAPIVKYRSSKDRWCLGGDLLEYRFDHVFIPAAKEDRFPDTIPTSIDFEHWPTKNKAHH